MNVNDNTCYSLNTDRVTGISTDNNISISNNININNNTNIGISIDISISNNTNTKTDIDKDGNSSMNVTAHAGGHTQSPTWHIRKRGHSVQR